MIVSCTGCGTKYKVADDKIGPSGVKVKCPKCRTVFEVKSPDQMQPESLAQKLFGREAVAGRRGESSREHDAAQAAPGQYGKAGAAPDARGPVIRGKAQEPQESEAAPEAAPAPRAESEPAGAASVGPEALPVAGPSAPEDAAEAEAVCAAAPAPGPEPVPGARKSTFPFKAGEEEPRTLARALVSDILFYNRETRDRGLAEGKVLAYLGREIARSWDVYKERVGIENAVETEFFRQAVNEILGEGKAIL
jgi:predicted Zn finger-like uncharacterized protein